MYVTFFVPGIPKPKGSKNAFVLPAKNGKKPRAVIVDQKGPELKRWASQVAWEADRFRPHTLFDGPVKLECYFRLPPPKALPKSKASYAIKKPDFDKLVRTVCDALSGVIYHDDSQIVESVICKRYDDSPGVEITVSSGPDYCVGLGYQP